MWIYYCTSTANIIAACSGLLTTVTRERIAPLHLLPAFDFAMQGHCVTACVYWNLQANIIIFFYLCNFPRSRDECCCSSCNKNGHLCRGQGLSYTWGKQLLLIGHCKALSYCLRNFSNNIFQNKMTFSGIPGHGRRGRQHQTGKLAKCDQHHPAGRFNTPVVAVVWSFFRSDVLTWVLQIMSTVSLFYSSFAISRTIDHLIICDKGLLCLF